MEDPLAVQVGESLGHLAAHLAHAGLGEGPRAAQGVEQVAALAVLSENVLVLMVLEVAEQGQHVPVGQPSLQADFVVQPARVVVAAVLVDSLHREGLVLCAAALENDAARAAAQQPDLAQLGDVSDQGLLTALHFNSVFGGELDHQRHDHVDQPRDHDQGDDDLQLAVAPVHDPLQLVGVALECRRVVLHLCGLVPQLLEVALVDDHLVDVLAHLDPDLLDLGLPRLQPVQAAQVVVLHAQFSHLPLAVDP